MFTYEPLIEYMQEHDLSYYDLEQTPLSHGAVYNIKYSQSIALPTLNLKCCAIIGKELPFLRLELRL